MKKNISFIYIIGLLTIGTFQFSQAQDADHYEILKGEFKNPPMSSWPKTYWWWLNGNIDTVRIKEEITSMKNAGLSGFDIFEIGKRNNDTIIPTGEITFMGADFLRAVKIAVDRATELDMEVGLNMASSWNAGGSWVTPEFAAKSIYFSKVPYIKGRTRVPFPKLVRYKNEGKIILKEDNKNVQIELDNNGRPIFYKEIAILAVPLNKNELKASDVIDVSPYYDKESEILNWDQEGEYEIYRYICSNSGEQLKLPSENSKGPIIDHFDPLATEFHFNYIIDRLKETLGSNLDRTALKSLYLASYEALGNVWTMALPKEFKRLNGYEIYPFMPALFDKTLFSEEITSRFWKDFQFTLSELMINNFYKKAKDICNANGLLINSESGGPGFPLHNVPAEPLKSLGAMDLPRGEFWLDHNRFNADGIDILRVVKEVSSASNIYGRGIVEEEAFTSFQHWQEGPFDMKQVGDRAFCEGMNKVVVHGSSHNPRGIGNPGIVYHAGTHYNDKRVWWSMVKPFNTYLSRISNVLQKTEFYADALYYYGDAAPNYTGHKNSRFTIGPGYDYEVINTEILEKLEVIDGNLVLPTGSKFKLLVMANDNEISAGVLAKIKALVSKGAKIISERPSQIHYRANNNGSKLTVKDIDDLWSDAKNLVNPHTIKNKVISGIQPVAMLKALNIPPDFYYKDAALSVLDYIHYTNDSNDYYFVRNTTNEWISRTLSFRQNEKSPELWDPVTGKVFKVTIHEQTGQHISLPLSLPPFGSMLIVFTKAKNKARYTNITSTQLHPPALQYTHKGAYLLEDAQVVVTRPTGKDTLTNFVKDQDLTGAWEVYFPNLKSDNEPFVFSNLTSWTEHTDHGIKYYSGIARYVKTFEYGINAVTAPNHLLYLDLGEISKIGEVWLNGNYLGVTWAKPHRFDVTTIVKPGINTLEVKVGNTWSNRLTGDALTGENHTFTNITETVVPGLNKTRVKWKNVPLLESGLMGPVKLTTLRPIEQ